jgi:hypothetical protein
LKAYKAKLIVFPRKAGNAKKGDSEAAEVAAAVQHRGALFPVEQVAAAPEARAITAEEKSGNAYMTLRYARSAARTLGAREKRARDKAEEEASKVILFIYYTPLFAVILTWFYLFQFYRRNKFLNSQSVNSFVSQKIKTEDALFYKRSYHITIFVLFLKSLCLYVLFVTERFIGSFSFVDIKRIVKELGVQ